MAIIFGKELPYNSIEGAWLTQGEYATLHRLAISNVFRGRGVINATLLRLAEDLCREQHVPAIRLEYTYCGTVQQSGAPRRAYEKVLLCT